MGAAVEVGAAAVLVAVGGGGEVFVAVTVVGAVVATDGTALGGRTLPADALDPHAASNRTGARNEAR